VVLPLTRLQAGVAVGLFGAPALPIEVTLACSGADALALCLGAIFAYPVNWRTRLSGAGGGAALILGLNTLRIGTLGRVAASPGWFNALHVYVWPAVLVVAVAGYVFGWMRVADRPAFAEASADKGDQPQRRLSATRRFVFLSAGCFLLFVAASPLYLESASALVVAAFVARMAAAAHRLLGFQAIAAGNLLVTSGGALVVTRECISTPLIPIYLAAVLAYAGTYRRMALGLLAMPPLFVALGIVRLLVVALPDAMMASAIFLVHAFYQLLLGAVVVFLAALWRHRGRAALGHALAGVVAGVLFLYLLGPVYTRLVTYLAGAPPDDPQGALALLPAFQVGLYLALWVAAFVAVGWRRFVSGLAVLALTQAAGLLALHALASHSGLTAHVRDVRAWAIAGPVLIFAAVVDVARARR
jgi:exosortase/archaeosortase family protein